MSIDHEDRQVVTVPRWAMLECGGDPRDAMVLAQVSWWFQPSQRDGTPRTSHIIERDGETWMYLTDAELADDIGMSRAQVQRARTALVKRGLLASKSAKIDGQKVTLLRPTIPANAGSRVSEQSNPDRAYPRDSGSREVARSRARGVPLLESREPLAPIGAGGKVRNLFGNDPAETPEDPNVAMARRLADAVFKNKRPKPAGRNAYMGVRAVALALLEVDHPPRVIYDAMLAAGTITMRSMEVQIARDRPPSRGESRVEEREAR